MTSDRPLALTQGDPAGIGPEIIVRALAGGHELGSVVVVGDPRVLQQAAAAFAPGLALRVVEDPSAAAGEGLFVFPAGLLEAPLVPGEVRAAHGKAAREAISCAARMALAHEVSGIVTAPLHKAAFMAAGSPHPGHTEFLSELAGGVPVSMMMVNSWLRVVLVTIHCPLAEVSARVTFAAECAAIRQAFLGGRALGLAQPRIAVCGLNPHAGEDGRFGLEEKLVIGPAIAALRAEGLLVQGPFPADTLFQRVREGEFDLVVAQYHDQGLIPIKTEGFAEGVNVTLGLPFVRTSPDHGTAFDRAWQGRADPASLVAALRLARRLADSR